MAASAAQRGQTRSASKHASKPATTLVKSGAPTPRAGAPAGTNGTARRPAPGETIEQCVLRSLEQYFADLDGAKPHALHEMVMTAVERPLLQFALTRCGGNQSAAAELLGINRNTLRKRLLAHGLAT